MSTTTKTRRGREWEIDGLCGQTDPDVFHPEGGGDGGAKAKRVCLACPVREECLQWALEAGPIRVDGIWGATNREERRLIRRAARLSAKQSAA